MSTDTSALHAIPTRRRLGAGAATALLGLVLAVAGLAPILGDAPAWLRIAGVFLFLVGALLALISAGLLNSVRVDRARRRDFEAQLAVDTAAARIIADECAADGPGESCGTDACGGSCALSALRRS